MTTTRTSFQSPATLPAILVRLLLMAAIVVALVVLSTPLRTINPLNLRITTNILFFIALGIADEWLLAPLLNRVPLARAAVLIAETLALGWFFSPRVGPRFLFFTHVAPFFVAVFGGALLVLLVRWWRMHRA